MNFRLLLGLASAIGLWFNAKPISMLRDPAWNVRYSPRVASPVNIGSGILLPADYSEWDEEKLRVVLAHERSHIRQGDFYLQLLAGLCHRNLLVQPAWLVAETQLYELGEAISDRAGLEEAASRTSYAQLLLEFAALPRPNPHRSCHGTHQSSFAAHLNVFLTNQASGRHLQRAAAGLSSRPSSYRLQF